MDEILKYQIALTFIKGIGPVLAKKLIAYVGSAEGIFREKERSLIKIPGIGEYLAKQVSKQDVMNQADAEMEFISKHQVKTLFYLDKDYPGRLKHCIDAPVLLYMLGEADLNMKKAVSIVGTRKATSYGKDLCLQIVSGLSAGNHDVLVVSGLAFGIDVTAHKAALSNGLQTVAVLGHGLDMIYPSQHRHVAKEIIGQGALVTEFSTRSEFLKQNFVRRNRIVAGMTDATIVVESSNKGGALITAELANSYSRDVFAFPGRIDDRHSSGCNRLIKTNKAALIESVKDIEYLMGWDAKKKKDHMQLSIPLSQLSNDENKIYALLKNEGQLDIDMLGALAGIPVYVLSALLLNLEFSGLVKSLPGKIYAAVK